jgi:hypothetical protein
MDIEATTPLGSRNWVRYTGVPDACPVCKHACYAIQLNTAVTFPEAGNTRDWTLQILFRCPRQTCGRLFIGEYFARGDYRSMNYQFELSKVYPRTPDKAEIAEGVETISPEFANILNQSLAAESHNLDQIVGMGLRKALEFLIKDYCIHKHPEKSAEIKERPLGQCITDYITDANIHRCAKRATWLGNDETHYSRAWTDLDINDLKILIRLTQQWISNELLTEKYFSKMAES